MTRHLLLMKWAVLIKVLDDTYISKAEEQAPGSKAANSRLTVLLSGSVSGHLIKPVLIYKLANLMF